MLTISEQCYNISDMRNDGLRFKRLIEKRDALVNRLSAYRYILRGTIVNRGNICGKAICRCKRKNNPLLHGPYNYLSHRSRKFSNMIFLNKKKLIIAAKGIKEYNEAMNIVYQISEINFKILRHHYARLSDE